MYEKLLFQSKVFRGLNQLGRVRYPKWVLLRATWEIIRRSTPYHWRGRYSSWDLEGVLSGSSALWQPRLVRQGFNHDLPRLPHNSRGNGLHVLRFLNTYLCPPAPLHSLHRPKNCSSSLNHNGERRQGRSKGFRAGRQSSMQKVWPLRTRRREVLQQLWRTPISHINEDRSRYLF